ncbi:RluA family pseudouridine synthase [Salimicrobium halophilum]|uniref:Pseudouridine synthase n=1 Tax=Salimicrobium halophilum TaxID=86666 RepID=A0A1G8QFR2_9BACI|nr:RluA family pseudouridine synthase [Salimicrobium halophilum]SDJ03265.1 ribosomal large subunit pseudouridine synthase D [Salimicrobium halophilum]
MSEQMVVTEEDKSERIDKWLSEALEDVSRAQVQQWIKEHHVSVNGRHVKSNYKLQPGDQVEWSVPEVKPATIEKENIPLEIVYEDEHMLVVNKPAGMVVHPSAGHYSGTLVNGLLYYCDDLSGINGVERPGIVHRIDKDTSGLLMVAKNDKAHQSLAEQLQDKTVERTYEAIVHGVVAHDHGTIDAPIGRDPKERQRMAVIEGGKDAVTHFTVKKRFADFTHLTCRLETGRTHQIRVHMRYIEHPLAGDPKYGPRKTLALPGQALHAGTLGFTHPATGDQLRFTVEPPEEFQEALNELSESG